MTPQIARFALLLAPLLLPLFSLAHGDPAFRYIENAGQWDDHILFRTAVPSGNLFLEADGFAYHFYDEEVLASTHGPTDSIVSLPETMRHHGLLVKFVDANSAPTIVPAEKAREYYNFYLGRNQKRWRSNVGAYERVAYNGLYPGIDLELYTQRGAMKYDVFVAPNANPAQMRFRYEGANSLQLSKGNLLVTTSLGELMEEKPFAYQIINGSKVEVPCHFVLEDDEVSFAFPNGYNKALELVIDPSILFSTYSGSFANNFGYTATFDSHGFLYSGSTAFASLANYPTTIGAFQTAFAGGQSGIGGTDVAITKYDTTGTFMVYSTYLGGLSDEMPHSLVVNRYNELYVFGTTGSNNFPITPNAYDTSFAGGVGAADLQAGLGVLMTPGSDIFVTAFSDDGTALKASTYLGGTDHDGLNFANLLNANYADEVRGEILIDRNNGVYVASCTESHDFPTTPGVFQPDFGGGNQDGFVAKLDESLSSLIWSTFYGGEGDDALYSIALTDEERAYVAGGTTSNLLPVTPGVLQNMHVGTAADGFLGVITSDGSALVGSTYWGTPRYDQIYFVELDRFNNAYVFGQTAEPGSPFIHNAAYGVPSGGQFISKLSPKLDSVIWSTQFGDPDTTLAGAARPDISPTAFLVDLCSKIYLSGWGSPIQGGGLSTTNLLVTPDAYDTTTTGGDFYLMVMEDDASAISWASYYGGDQSTEHVDGGTSRFDRKGRIYQSVCAGCGGNDDFPIKPDPGAVSSANNNSCNNGVFKIDFNLPIVVADFTSPAIGCAPFDVQFTNTSLEQSATIYLWDFGDGDTSSATNPIHTYDSAGLFNVMLVVSDTATCNLADTLILPVRVLSDSSYSLSTIIRCDSSFVQIGVPPVNNNGFSYTWLPSTGLTDSSVANPFAAPDSTQVYQLLLSNGTCTDTLYQQVQVSSDLAVNFATPNLPCNSGTVQFQASGDFQPTTQFIWSFGDGTTDSIPMPTHTYPGVGNYIVTLYAADSMSCNGNDTITGLVTIFVDSNIVLTQQDICVADSVAIGPTPQAGTTYTWFPATGLSDSTASNPLAFPATTTTYTLLAFDGVCTDTITQTVDVRPELLSGFSITNTGCVPDTVVLNSTGTIFAGTQLQWLVNGQPYSTAADTSIAILQSGAFDIVLTYTDASTCNLTVSSSDSLQLLADTSYTLPPVPLCQGDSVAIGPSGLDPTLNFSWTPATGLESASVANPMASPGSTTNYVLIASNGICADTVSQTVNVVSFTVQASADTTICEGETVTLNANSTGSITSWVWSSNALAGDTLNANLASPLFSITPTNDSTLHIFATDANGCRANDATSIAVNNVSIAAQDTALCIGDTIDVAATALEGANLSWNWSPTTFIVGATNTQTVAVTPDASTSLTVVATDSIGCSDQATVAVTVGQLLEIDVYATADDDSIAAGTSTLLHAFPMGINDYNWTPAPTLSTPTEANTLASPLVTTSYSVDVTDPTGRCSYKGEIIVRVYEVVCGEPEIFVPNAFTPNDDAENDVLFVRGRNIGELYFALYNRWGERVFETRNKDMGWDGVFKGMKADPGVFVYYLEVTCVDGQEYFHKGNVTLFR